jgi:hypothetical protein
VPDLNIGKAKRTGRPRKVEGDKRVPLSLRINPDLRNELEAAAREENRSLTQISEFALAAFLEARRKGTKEIAVSPSPPTEQWRIPDGDTVEIPYDPWIGNVASLAAAVFQSQFGRQGVTLLLFIAYAIQRVVEIATDERDTEAEWLSNPFVFHHVKAAIQFLLETLDPGGDLATPPDPLPDELFRNGEAIAYALVSMIVHHSDQIPVTEILDEYLLEGLGKAELARLRSRVKKLWDPVKNPARTTKNRKNRRTD